MKRRSFLYVLPAAILSLVANPAGADRPNIVFILADDLGWHDVGFNGEDFFETPNLDQLAADGMRFDRAYSGGPNCLPTRVCLISGMYTPRTRIWTPGGKSKGNGAFMKLHVPGPSGGNTAFESNLSLDPGVTSIAEVLTSVGYKTARYGKWHVGPDTQGFDISDPSGKGGKIGSKYYNSAEVAGWLTDASVRFIEDHRDDPFFLYLAHWDVHMPLKAQPESIEKYAAKLAAGTWGGKKNATYAAMIEAVDTSVGRVRSKLRELDLEENTLLIFSSDNGGSGGVTSNLPLRGAKGSLYEGGVRVPTCMSWPGVTKPGSVCNIPITSVDFLPTFAEMAQAGLPTNQPVDGKSIVPLLRGERVLEDRAIFWHYPLYLTASESPVEPVFGTDVLYWRGVPSSAIMKGDWKLIHCFEDDSVRLFDLEEDLGERKNLAESFSHVAQELLTELRAWQKETNAPIPTEFNPDFDPSGVRDATKNKTKNKKRKRKSRSQATERNP